MIQLSQDLGKENCQLALSLIEYPEETKSTMAWIFGQIFICKVMNVAKKVAFHKQINRKCITLDGDVFDPSGVFSGGAAAKGGSNLLNLNELNEMQHQLNEKENARIAGVANVAQKFTNLKPQFDINKT